MNAWLNDRNRIKRGFSLAEVLVVVGIMAVLAAVSFPAVIHVRDSLRQTELDRMARSVFIAAQNQLSGLRLCGDLPDISEEGIPMPDDSGRQPSDYNPSMGERPDTYVICDAYSGSDFTWMDDTAFSPGNVKADGGSYAIEYNRSAGRVYAVFYWEQRGGAFQRDSSFSYPPDDFNLYGGQKLRGDENKNNRKVPSVGYYGGEAGTLMDSGTEMDFQVIVKNEADLRIEIQMPEAVQKTSVFEILLSSKTDGENPAVYKYKASPDSQALITPEETQTEGVLTAQKGLYALTLDSLREGLHFADNFPGICPGDDLKLSVTGYSASGQALYLPVTRAVETNSLFAGLRDQGGRGPNVYIENGRHLQNLSHEVSALGRKEGGGGETTGYEILSARLMKDIDWAETVYEGGTLSWDGASTANKYSGLGKVNFHPISNDNTGLQVFDGNNHSIANLHVTRNYKMKDAGGSYGQAGLFGYFAFNPSKGSPEAAIRNVSLINPLVKPLASPESSSYAGSLAGYLVGVKVKNCGAYVDGAAAGLGENDQWDELYEDTGVQAFSSGLAGGLIGCGENIEAESSFASVKVKGGSAAGGFAGALREGTSVSRCYSGGRTEGGAYIQERPNVTGMTSAGGFTGVLDRDVRIEKSFSSCSVNGMLCGPFVGQTGATLAEQAANLNFTYGLGSAFKNEGVGSFVNSVGCGPVGDNLTGLGGARIPASEDTHPYDKAYREENQSYPYPVWLKDYYGDWQGAAFTGFVYYEKYQLADGAGDGSPQAGEYGFWSPEGKEGSGDAISGIQTLNDDKPVLSDGYGYLSAGEKEVTVQQGGKGNVHKLDALEVKIEGLEGIFHLYVLPWKDVTHIPVTSFEGNHGNTVNTFYDRLKFSIDGESYDAYYNPHFAKAIAADQAGALKGPEKALLRTARHLCEMAFVSNDGSKHNKAYWDASWDTDKVFQTYLVERDIDCRVYDGSTYADKDEALVQNVIGSGKAGEKFERSFDGGGKTISYLEINDEDYGYSFRGNAAALFGYVSSEGVISNLDLKYANITARYVQHAAGLVYTNEGTVSNVRIISPGITSHNAYGSAAGLVLENTREGEIENSYVIPEQENYVSEKDKYKHIYNGKDILVNNYANAAVTAPGYAAGFVVSNNGIIRSCAAVGAVTAGTVENGIIRPSDNGSAAGFVNDQNGGEITNSYSNCYTAGRFAAGFVNDAAGDGIRDCYSLRRVTSTYLNGYAAGFGGSTNAGSVENCYAAVSNGYCPNYRIEDGLIHYENTQYITTQTFLYNFSQYPHWLSNCYFLSWSENYEDVSAPSGRGLTYRQLKENHEIKGLEQFERGEPDGSDTEPFSLMLAPVYPFPKTADMIHYGDWPSYEYVGAELAYFEVYKEDDRYTVGMYNENLELDTLWDESDGQDPPDIFLDGYALLFNDEYIDMDNVDLNNLIQGAGSSNSEAYLTWEDNVGTDNTTNSATNYLKSVFSLKDNEGNRLTGGKLEYYNNVTGDVTSFEEEAGGDLPIELALDGRAGKYYFRILPPAAVVTNAYVPEDSVFQPLAIYVKSNYEDEGGGEQTGGQKVEKSRVFYYTPHFAKSDISVGQRPEEPEKLLVRTVRQLCTLGTGNIKNNKDSIGRYYDKTFLQEYDIPLGQDGAYAYFYSDTAPMASGSMYRNRHNYRWFNSSIGNAAYPFRGTYDGGGYTISGLGSWSRTPDILGESPFGGIARFNANVPLFGYLTGRVGVIEETDLNGRITPDNLVIDRSSVEGAKSIFCGVSKGGMIQGVTVKNSSLTPNSGSAGILLGEGTEQTLMYTCSVADSGVLCGSGDYSYIGIAAGYINSGAAELRSLSISNSSVQAVNGTTVNNATRVGGVAGYISGGKITNVKMSGTITIQGRRGVGGIAGQILSDKGEVLISDIEITGTADISQLKANHGAGENLYSYNAVGLVAGLSEIGSPVTLDNLSFCGSGPGAGGDGLLKVRNGSECSNYIGGFLIGSMYRNGGSGTRELILGNVSLDNAVLSTDRSVSAPASPRCYYGGIAGRAGNVNISPRSPHNIWDFSGGLIQVEPERIDPNSGISGLVGNYVTPASITLPGEAVRAEPQVKLPDISVTVPAGSSVPVSGIVNSTAASVTVSPAAGAAGRIQLGSIITENCDNTGGLTALLSDNTLFGSNIALWGGRIQATGRAGAAAGTVNTRSTIANISVDNVTVTGNGSLGGFAGVLEAGTIENCYANAAVTGDGSRPVGGFAGSIEGGTLQRSYASGFVTGRNNVGGFFGAVTKSGVIRSCYATGNVYALPVGSAKGAIGGFGGSLVLDGSGSVSIAQCYSLGRVPDHLPDMDGGGFIGKTDSAEDNFDVLDQMIGNLITIMKSAEIHNRPVGNGENGASVWSISQTMDSSTRGAINSAGTGYSAAVYNILGYPYYHKALMAGIAAGSDAKADNSAITSAYWDIFDSGGGLKEQTDPDSYYQLVYTPSRDNGLMTLWQIKGRDLYWINEADWALGESYAAYKVNLDAYAGATDGEARKALIETRKLSVSRNATASYGQDYIVLSTRTDGWEACHMSSVNNCFFLKEDGTQGLGSYNEPYSAVTAGTGIHMEDWSVAEFSAELTAELEGSGALEDMRPDGSVPSQQAEYPYPMVEHAGAGISGLHHSGYWPEGYRPVY